MRAHQKAICIFALISIFSHPNNSYAGSFYNPSEPDFRESGQRAAAALNQGLSHFFLMLARLEEENVGSAREQAGAAIEALETSGQQFGDLLNVASDQPLTIDPQTERGKRAAEEIPILARNFGLSVPPTDRELVEFSIDRISDFLESMKSIDLSNLTSEGWNSRRDVISKAVDLQWYGLVVSDLWAASIH